MVVLSPSIPQPQVTGGIEDGGIRDVVYIHMLHMSHLNRMLTEADFESPSCTDL